MTFDQPMNLRQKLRANVVKRWHIVDTYRQQTVAEHSFNMCLLAEEICKLCNETSAIPEAIVYAIHHDIPEVIIGDIPSPTKRQYRIVDVQKCKMLDAQSIPPNEFVAGVVKLADLLDAVMFLQLYGVGRHTHNVRSNIIEQIHNLDIVRFDYTTKLKEFVNSVVSWETRDREGNLL